MKKLSVLLIAFLLYASAFAVHIKIKKSNGGKNGYNKVTEIHTKRGHTLVCTEPGYEKCAWEFPPKIKDEKNAQHIIEMIDEQIKNGFTGGTLNIESLEIKVKVSKVRIDKNGIISYVAKFDI